MTDEIQRDAETYERIWGVPPPEMVKEPESARKKKGPVEQTELKKELESARTRIRELEAQITMLTVSLDEDEEDSPEQQNRYPTPVPQHRGPSWPAYVGLVLVAFALGLLATIEFSAVALTGRLILPSVGALRSLPLTVLDLLFGFGIFVATAGIGLAMIRPSPVRRSRRA